MAKQYYIAVRGFERHNHMVKAHLAYTEVETDQGRLLAVRAYVGSKLTAVLTGDSVVVDIDGAIGVTDDYNGVASLLAGVLEAFTISDYMYITAAPRGKCPVTVEYAPQIPGREFVVALMANPQELIEAVEAERDEIVLPLYVRIRESGRAYELLIHRDAILASTEKTVYGIVFGDRMAAPIIIEDKQLLENNRITVVGKPCGLYPIFTYGGEAADIGYETVEDLVNTLNTMMAGTGGNTYM